jgi:hypothetical protein
MKRATCSSNDHYVFASLALKNVMAFIDQKKHMPANQNEYFAWPALIFEWFSLFSAKRPAWLRSRHLKLQWLAFRR